MNEQKKASLTKNGSALIESIRTKLKAATGMTIPYAIIIERALDELDRSLTKSGSRTVDTEHVIISKDDLNNLLKNLK